MSMTRARGNHAEAAATKRLYLKDNWIRQQPPPEKTRSIYDAKVETLGLEIQERRPGSGRSSGTGRSPGS